METLLWDSDIRLFFAWPLATLGAWLMVVGSVRQVRSLRKPLETRGRNHTWLRAMRQMLQGIALLSIGLGWAWQVPVMIAAGAIFGFEETIETSIVTWALKQEADGRPGYA
jgi:hypothetical protein